MRATRPLSARPALGKAWSVPCAVGFLSLDVVVPGQVPHVSLDSWTVGQQDLVQIESHDTRCEP
jgi:hypothetical protein